MVFRQLLVAGIFGAAFLGGMPNSRAQSCTVDSTANFDQRQPAGTCSIRGLVESECRSVSGFRHFKPDNGLGWTECFFAPPSGSNQSGSRPPSPDNGKMAAGLCNSAISGLQRKLANNACGDRSNCIGELIDIVICRAAGRGDVVTWALNSVDRQVQAAIDAKKRDRFQQCRAEMTALYNTRRAIIPPNSAAKAELLTRMRAAENGVCAEWRNDRCEGCTGKFFDSHLASLPSEIEQDKVAEIIALDPVRTMANPFVPPATANDPSSAAGGFPQPTATNNPFRPREQQQDGSGAGPMTPNPFQNQQRQQLEGCGSDVNLGGQSEQPRNCNSGSNVLPDQRNASGSSSSFSRMPPVTEAQKQSHQRLRYYSRFEIDIIEMFDQHASRNDALGHFIANVVISDVKDEYRAYLGCAPTQSDKDCLVARFDQIYNWQVRLAGGTVDPSDPKVAGGTHPNTAAKPQEPTVFARGEYCEPYPNDARLKICWRAASNGYCRKWLVEEATGRVQPRGSIDSDDTYSDNLIGSTSYTLACPPGALKAYRDAGPPGSAK